MVSSNNIKENNFTKVANLKDFQEGSLMKVEVKGNSIVLAMVNGQIHAMNSVCSHQDGPLEEGTLDGYDITCPLYYAVLILEMVKYQIVQFGQLTLSHTK